MDLGYIAAGFIVGVLVGLTGVGGGSLMTPMLIFAFNVPAMTAVGTDLLFAAVTKAGGIWTHMRRGNVKWRVVFLLMSGSIPTAVITIMALDAYNARGVKLDAVIHAGLGMALVLTALSIVFRSSMNRVGNSMKTVVPQWRLWRPAATVLAGVVLGVLVPISSIGAGALGAAMLLFLYPNMPMRRLVGTDLAHAVPLTLIAGMGHWHMGSVDFKLLGILLIGSLPGIYLGSHLSTVIPERILRPILASVLMAIGVKFMFTG